MSHAHGTGSVRGSAPHRPHHLSTDCGSVLFTPAYFPFRVHLQYALYLVYADGSIVFERATTLAAKHITTTAYCGVRGVHVSLPCVYLDSIVWDGYFARILDTHHADFIAG